MVADGWHEGCQRAIELLKFGGDGHSVVIHSRDEEAIMAFGVEKPAFRVLVNTWGCLGGVGYTTGLRPSFTLAPGGIGGAVVSDNITVENVLNIKRVAYHVNPAPDVARAFRGVLTTEDPQEADSPEDVARPSEAAPDDTDLIDKLVKQVLAELKATS